MVGLENGMEKKVKLVCSLIHAPPADRRTEGKRGITKSDRGENAEKLCKLKMYFREGNLSLKSRLFSGWGGGRGFLSRFFLTPSLPFLP